MVPTWEIYLTNLYLIGVHPHSPSKIMIGLLGEDLKTNQILL